EERDYGVLFYNRANPISHDSNHALILKLDFGLDAAIADVCAFYRELGVAPRIYHGFVPGATEVLLPRLLAQGFKMEVFDEEYLICTGASVIQPVAGLEVRRVRRLDDGIMAIFAKEPWSIGVIERQLGREDYHLLVGYASGVPVTMAALDVGRRVARVDDVMTHPAHRRRGFGRALIHGLVNHHRQVSDNPLYLYSGVPSALRIYHEAGFRKLDWKPYKWSAWLES
ncbi:MAG: GNAT family N-acetyltransferase, partial [Opitutaceae bacterium]|nr:GNAT family N-acetyltransferase [Opitutaceae bacterium]